MASKTPTRKVAAGTSAAATATVLIWVLGRFGIDMPMEVAAALTGLLSQAAAYLTKD